MFIQTCSATSPFNPHWDMDKTFSPTYSSSQITYVEAEAVEFLRFLFHIPGCDRRNFPRTCLSGSQLSWQKLAKGRSGLVLTFHRCEEKLTASFRSYNSPTLLDVAQESRLSPSGDVLLQPQLTCWQLKSQTYRQGCGNVGMVAGVNREHGGL